MYGVVCKYENGVVDYGPPNTLEVATSTMKWLNQEYPKIKHWIEPVN
jgi:hypothetical protein